MPSRLRNGASAAAHDREEIVRDRRFDRHAFAGHGVRKRDPARVEHLARGRRGTPAVVELVADDRVVLVREVNADLVRAAGVGVHLHDGDLAAVPEPLADDLPRGDRFASLPGARDRHALVVRVAHDGGVHHVHVGRGPAVDDGEVGLLHVAVGERLRELAERLRGLRDDERAAGVLVEPVHDAGPHGVEILVVEPGFAPEHGVHHGPVPVARRRMHHHARGLVDDQQHVVLVDHVQRDVLALGTVGHGREGIGEAGDGSGGEFEARHVADFAVHGELAVADELLDMRAREVGAVRRQHLVDAFVRVEFAERELVHSAVVSGSGFVRHRRTPRLVSFPVCVRANAPRRRR